ncbi:hypothetical protein IC575_011706 [Cucumis melo]
MMAEKLPGTNIQGSPTIDCRVKSLKKTYHAIAEMRGPSCSGFGWNEEFQCIIAERDLFDSWIKSHPAAKGLLHKSFPYYDDLSYVFGKDRTTGARSETFPNVRSNVSNMFNDTIPLGDSHDEDIPTMYSQGVHMSPDEMFGIRAGQASERRNCSSVSKRKRGSERYETVEVIRSVMEFGNEQLKAIADWPKEKSAMEVEMRAQVVKQLQDIPKLRSQDRAKLMQILFRSLEAIEGFLSIPTELKLEYCNILLQNIV